MRYLLSPSARRDIDNIWTFGAGKWGASRAERYIRAIEAVLQALSENPKLGRACDDIRLGYRKLPAGSHTIYYRIRDDAIDIVRILHGRADVRRHI